jgi:predicted transcriptional regulator
LTAEATTNEKEVILTGRSRSEGTPATRNLLAIHPGGEDLSHNTSPVAHSCEVDITSCCEKPSLIEQRGETFCANCGLVTQSKRILLNKEPSLEVRFEKHLALSAARKLSESLKIDEKVPYNILTHFNRKYGISIYNFSLPRVTCVGKTPICDKICYGNVYAFRYGNVIARYKHNLALTKRGKFVFLVVSQIRRRNIKHIRIHTIGDFYNQEYFDKWCEIARMCPETKILAYTRNWELDASHTPDNFIIYYSVDYSTKRFNPTISRLAITFKAPPDVTEYKHLEIIPGAKVCSSRCHFCKFCWTGSSNVAFPIAQGKRSYKPKAYHTPFQLSDDWTGKRSKRKKKEMRTRKLIPDLEFKVLKVLEQPKDRDSIVKNLNVPRTTIFDKIKKLMNVGIIDTEPEVKVHEMGKEMRGRPRTIFKLTDKGMEKLKNETDIHACANSTL